MDDCYSNTCPMSQQAIIDEYFIEYRTQILAIAAFLDRMDRSVTKDGEDEFRYQSFRKALTELSTDEPGRAKRVQMILSDPRTELLEERDQQSAFGAYNTAVSHSNGHQHTKENGGF